LSVNCDIEDPQRGSSRKGSRKAGEAVFRKCTLPKLTRQLSGKGISVDGKVAGRSGSLVGKGYIYVTLIQLQNLQKLNSTRGIILGKKNGAVRQHISKDGQIPPGDGH